MLLWFFYFAVTTFIIAATTAGASATTIALDCSQINVRAEYKTTVRPLAIMPPVRNRINPPKTANQWKPYTWEADAVIHGEMVVHECHRDSWPNRN